MGDGVVNDSHSSRGNHLIISSPAGGAKFRTISDRATGKNSDAQTVEKAHRTNYK